MKWYKGGNVGGRWKPILIGDGHDLDITWPRESVRAQIFNSERPAVVAYSEFPATVAMLAGVFPKEMTAWLNTMVDAEADDKIALDPAERQKREAELQEQLLPIERQEASLVWKAQAQNMPAEHRTDCHPLAILGGQLVTIPAGAPSRGTSPEHAYDIVRAR